mmetsp:Transcript_60901/g.92002  ORF Transcript_60901/g.92002 Transcript_60901/m.92002 type:complete len:99 (+) Transcript_60901:1004-1300(+)
MNSNFNQSFQDSKYQINLPHLFFKFLHLILNHPIIPPRIKILIPFPFQKYQFPITPLLEFLLYFLHLNFHFIILTFLILNHFHYHHLLIHLHHFYWIF